MRLKLLVIGSAVMALFLTGTAANADHFPNQTLTPDDYHPGFTVTVGHSYEHQNAGGGRIIWMGSQSCTATYSDIDYREFELALEHAAAEVSSFTDYNLCDTKFWKDPGFLGSQTAWLNAGSSADNMPTGWNDAADSIKWT